ncbi:hypothetical protein BAUR920_03654 [Brevibacterium aurantiacum]|uniref:Uncharacterized protein n=1 Tax=Brevibacterium aurantiacum TaxID=273384 RepID=A0A2H1KV63_BREAU|nr:hypothetical protein BAUR920_03654 [Brevibacterium aurantiacum]
MDEHRTQAEDSQNGRCSQHKPLRNWIPATGSGRCTCLWESAQIGVVDEPPTLRRQLGLVSSDTLTGADKHTVGRINATRPDSRHLRADNTLLKFSYLGFFRDSCCCLSSDLRGTSIQVSKIVYAPANFDNTAPTYVDHHVAFG